METNCYDCQEELAEGDDVRSINSSDGPHPIHAECLLRSLIGSAAHILERCSCYVPGSTESDPPGLTKREAAQLAVHIHQHLTRHREQSVRADRNWSAYLRQPCLRCLHPRIGHVSHTRVIDLYGIKETIPWDEECVGDEADCDCTGFQEVPVQ